MTQKRAFAAFAVTVLLLGLGFTLYLNLHNPELGVTDGKFQPLSERPNGVSTEAVDSDKRVAPLPFKEDAKATMKAIKSALNASGSFEIVSETDDYLRVVFITPTMRFRDDAEFWLDPDKRVVEFRSQSRLGYSDMGLNRARYDALANRYLASSSRPD